MLLFLHLLYITSKALKLGKQSYKSSKKEAKWKLWHSVKTLLLVMDLEYIIISIIVISISVSVSYCG